MTARWGRQRDPLLFECVRGHQFELTRGALKGDAWCPQCAPPSDAFNRTVRAEPRFKGRAPTPLTLAEMQELARRFGGECLSKRYVNVDTPLRWKCARSHEWESSPANVQQRGAWCPHCSRRPPRTLEAVRALARRRGGRCRTTVANDRSIPVRFECARGHRFEAMWNALKTGVWCPDCPTPEDEIEEDAEGSQPQVSRSKIEDMRAHAALLGGRCVSDVYDSNEIRWQCAHGHVWDALPSNVKRGSWCPACARRPPFSLDDMRTLAKKNGGRCLTRTWDNRSKPVRFECAAGHRFELLRGALKSGLWCSDCVAAPRSTEPQIQDPVTKS